MISQIHGIDKLGCPGAHETRVFTETEKLKKEAVWQQIFDTMDKSGDGSIEPKELAVLLEDVAGDDKVSEEQVKRIVRTLDANGDGEIEFNEVRLHDVLTIRGAYSFVIFLLPLPRSSSTSR